MQASVVWRYGGAASVGPLCRLSWPGETLAQLGLADEFVDVRPLVRALRRPQVG